jgi:2-dehydropantoate 2-reductase
VLRYRIAIVGSGAIGSYYGGKLAAAGSDVHFLMRGDLESLRRNGLHIHGPDEKVHVAKMQCYNSTAQIGPCDLVLIALKTTANHAIVDLVPPLLHEGTMLLTLQNGLGNEELLARHFGTERVLGGLCFIALRRISRTEIERYAYGDIVLGEYRRTAQPRTHEVAAGFHRAGVSCTVTDDLLLQRWRKLVWNIPFNGLSILAGGLDTAAMLADQSLRQATVALMEEVVAAANACGHALGRNAIEEQIRRTATMGSYKPSTLLDWEAGRELEIEAIWGEPLRRAAAAGADMPRLKIIYAVLRALGTPKRA